MIFVYIYLIHLDPFPIGIRLVAGPLRPVTVQAWQGIECFLDVSKSGTLRLKKFKHQLQLKHVETYIPRPSVWVSKTTAQKGLFLVGFWGPKFQTRLEDSGIRIFQVSKICAKNHPKNLPKGRIFTYLEDPGIDVHVVFVVG